MRLLFIGDLVGRSGREAVFKHLPDLKNRLKPDFIIANVDNAAHGFGVNEKICTALYEAGIDCLTGGNHIWDQREVLSYINRDNKLLRPINFPEGTQGQGLQGFKCDNGQNILVIHALGRIFMDPLDDPFAAIDKALSTYRLGQGVHAIFIDIHAEATSEKMALAHFVDGRASAVIGTHTHLPTADYQILPGGTAFQADAGMTGDYDSVIGMNKAEPIHKFTKKTPTKRMSPATGEATLCGTFIITDEKTGLARSIQPVRAGGRLSQAIPEG